MSNIKLKFQTLSFKTEKGVSLLFVVLITSIILAIGLGVNAILIKQIKMTEEIGHSVKAFYAADSGIEQALYDLYKLPVSHQPIQTGTCGSANFEVRLKCGTSVLPADCPSGLQVDSSCSANNICIKSLGNYQKVKRAIEIKY